jgi:hypothetical protein
MDTGFVVFIIMAAAVNMAMAMLAHISASALAPMRVLVFVRTPVIMPVVMSMVTPMLVLMAVLVNVRMAMLVRIPTTAPMLVLMAVLVFVRTPVIMPVVMPIFAPMLVFVAAVAVHKNIPSHNKAAPSCPALHSASGRLAFWPSGQPYCMAAAKCCQCPATRAKCDHCERCERCEYHATIFAQYPHDIHTMLARYSRRTKTVSRPAPQNAELQAGAVGGSKFGALAF